MSVEWSLSFKSNSLELKEGFLIAYQMLLFEEIELSHGNSVDELKEFKIVLLNDAVSIYAGWCGGIDFNGFSEATINELIRLTERMICKVKNDKSYLTSSHIYHICKEAFEYLTAIGKSDWGIQFGSSDFMYAEEELPIENYVHAFQLIKLLLMGTLTHEDINGLLVG